MLYGRCPLGEASPSGHLGQRVAGLLPGQVRHQHRPDRGQVDPRLEHERAHRVDHDDDAGVRRRRAPHQRVAAVPRREPGPVPVAVVALHRVRVLAGVGAEEDDGDVVGAGFRRAAPCRERVGLVVRDVGDLPPQRRDRVVEVRVVGAAGAPAHAQRAAVAALVGTRVDTLRVGARVGTEDAERHRGAQRQQAAVVLEQRDGLLRDLLRHGGVVPPHVDEPVDHARGREQRARVQRADGVGRVGREVRLLRVTLVLAEVVPGRDDARRHVVQPVRGQGAVQHRPRQLVHPVAVARQRDRVGDRVARHRHVEPRERRPDARQLRQPVRHHKALEPQLVLQEAVDQVAVLGRRGSVDLQRGGKVSWLLCGKPGVCVPRRRGGNVHRCRRSSRTRRRRESPRQTARGTARASSDHLRHG